MSACKSCGAQIRWVTMPASGKLMPLDDSPAEDGNIVVQEGRGFVLSKDESEMYRGPRFKSHFATCPDSATFRGRSAADP